MLTIQDIAKSYGNEQAVTDLSLNVKKSQIIGLIGTNGSGKTTTFRMILNLTNPDKGNISWNGVDIRQLSSDSIGYLPEERGLDSEMTIEQHLLYLSQLKGLAKKEASLQIDAFLKDFKVIANKKTKIGNLSKGNQQKIQLIASILHQPELIILDEPFSGLDPINTHILKEQILRIKKENNASIIFSSHNMENIEEICDYLIMIHDGKTVLNGSIRDIKESYGRKKLILSKNKITEKVIEQRKDQFESVETTRNGLFSIVLSHSDVGKEIFREIVKKENYVEVFFQDFPSLGEIFRKVVETYGED